MIGITMDELITWLIAFHEAEFTYKGKQYIMQPELDKKKGQMFEVIWYYCPEDESKSRCISKHPIPLIGEIPLEELEPVLNDKCFDGKSFMEIEKEVTVDGIF